MIINDPALLNQISIWRTKAVDGSITLEEMREAIKVLRANRTASQEAAAKSKAGGRSKKSPAAPVDAGSLLDQLNGL